MNLLNYTPGMESLAEMNARTYGCALLILLAFLVLAYRVATHGWPRWYATTSLPLTPAVIGLIWIFVAMASAQETGTAVAFTGGAIGGVVYYAAILIAAIAGDGLLHLYRWRHRRKRQDPRFIEGVRRQTR